MRLKKTIRKDITLYVHLYAVRFEPERRDIQRWSLRLDKGWLLALPIPRQSLFGIDQ